MVQGMESAGRKRGVMMEGDTFLVSRCLTRNRNWQSVDKNSARGTVKLQLLHNKPSALREEIGERPS